MKKDLKRELYLLPLPLEWYIYIYIYMYISTYQRLEFGMKKDLQKRNVITKNTYTRGCDQKLATEF